ncbi:hypothetical protein C8J57DRAFT_1227233 [Mycena rebaudengoi]|nr:hypothetical protein C8J57DRAFT_1227233 [Mycena rebaudengoi]
MGAYSLISTALSALSVLSGLPIHMGLSNKSKIKYGRVGGSGAKQTVIPVNRTPIQRAASQRAFNQSIAGLSFVQREEMLDIDMPYAYREDNNLHLGGDDGDDDDWETIGPGEEGSMQLQSHAGGEAIMHQIAERMRPGQILLFTTLHILLKPAYSRGDPRTRSYRIQKEIDKWNAQMPWLVDAYLQYKNTGPIEIEGTWPLNVLGFEGLWSHHAHRRHCKLIFILEAGPRLFSHSPDSSRSNQTLILQGYIGSSPEKPAIAFSIRTF